MENDPIEDGILEAQRIAPINSKWRHLKTNGNYAVTGYVVLEHSAKPAICYAALGHDQLIWARDADEFLDGRFLSLSTEEGERLEKEALS